VSVRARRAALVCAACVAAAWLSACGTTSPPEPVLSPDDQAQLPRRGAPRGEGSTRIHVVQRGETAYSISRRYGTTVAALAQANGLADATRLSVGQRLRVPAGEGVELASIPPGRGDWSRADPRGQPGSLSLAWPVGGSPTSGFGVRNGAHHDGLDIPMPRGTPVRAAESGRVIHSGSGLAGYGNLVILRHAGRISTVYAHNRRNLVRVGEFVERGQVIAEVGESGNATTPHLHFEVRRDGSPIDPLRYLPCRTRNANDC
jgi:murein DD-endopeptidase MepM/ murein hydrolase activator NlpD